MEGLFALLYGHTAEAQEAWDNFKCKSDNKYHTFSNKETFTEIYSLGIDAEALFLEKINKLEK